MSLLFTNADHATNKYLNKGSFRFRKRFRIHLSLQNSWLKLKRLSSDGGANIAIVSHPKERVDMHTSGYMKNCTFCSVRKFMKTFVQIGAIGKTGRFF